MLVDSLFSNAVQHSADIAIHDDTGSYTFQQLGAMSAGLAKLISSQTSRPHVGLLLPSGAAFVSSFYGTLAAGKSVVPINFLLSDREIQHVIADSGIDCILTITPLAKKVAADGLKVIDLLSLPRPDNGAFTPGATTQSGDDLAVLMYTSGTSGLPKGVMLTYQNLQSDVDAAIEHAQLQGTHRFLGIIPLFHSTGMLATMIAPVTLGSMTVYMARFSPVAVVKAIAQHQLSVIAAVPSMYGAILRLKDAGPDDLKSLYAAISGGEPLPENIREGFIKRFNKPILEGYGLTETIGPVAFNTPQANKPGSVGKPIHGVDVKITDDAGNSSRSGESGEVWLRGPMIMKGYYNQPDLSAQAITPDGFFKTGDLGRFDADGFLHITGRKKDLIIIAGENVSPREIEEILMRHPTIQEAAVVGKKDPSRGEVVTAFVVPREGHQPKPDELRDFCRENGMAQFKIPREIFMVKDLPHSPTGKVLKRVLADWANNATPSDMLIN